MAVLHKVNLDLPFCANHPLKQLVYCAFRDLNPLYNTEQRPDYRDKYYSPILPLGQKFVEVST